MTLVSLPGNCYGRTEVCSMTLKDIADLAGVSMMTVSMLDQQQNQPRFPVVLVSGFLGNAAGF